MIIGVGVGFGAGKPKTKFLSMDGVDDYLKTPSISFTKIVLDCEITQPTNATNHYVLDARPGYATGYVILNSNSGNYGISGGTLSEDGVNKNLASAVTRNKRMTVQWVVPLSTAIITIFARYTNVEFLAGKIYDIKIYNGANLVAHYDMATGTVQDQSGNNNHATLTGSAWVEA